MQQLQNATIRRASPDDCARELLATLPAVMRFIRTHMRQYHRAELTEPQFRTLVFLSHNGDSTLSALAEFLALSPPAASRMVDLLVKRGLIDRQTPSSNRRRVSLSLTALGKEKFQTALAATQAAMTKNFQILSSQERGLTREALRALSRVFAPENCQPDMIK